MKMGCKEKRLRKSLHMAVHIEHVSLDICVFVLNYDSGIRFPLVVRVNSLL